MDKKFELIYEAIFCQRKCCGTCAYHEKPKCPENCAMCSEWTPADDEKIKAFNEIEKILTT